MTTEPLPVTAPTAAARCLAILLPEILSYLSLRNILRCMAASRLWRDYAINHPTYYGDLHFAQNSGYRNPDLFYLRLSRSAGRPISVWLDLGGQSPLRLIEETGQHLAHIVSLTLSISYQHSAPAVLKHLCGSAPMLRKLVLRHGATTDLPDKTRASVPPAALPASLLACDAPRLNSVHLSGIDLLSGIPLCFSSISVLCFFARSDSPQLTLPDPLTHCPELRELHLLNSVTLLFNANGGLSRHLLADVSFSGSSVASRWPAFGLALDHVPRIVVRLGNALSLLALADTLTGPLHITLPPPRRRLHPAREPGREASSIVTAVIILSAMPAGNRERVFEGLLYAKGSFSVFSTPSFADRISQLDLPLEAWDDFVGLSTFGPFNALDVLILDLTTNAVFSGTTASRLSCPKLQRLGLRDGGTQATSTVADNVHVDAVAMFASTSLPDARFPLRLELHGGVKLAGRLDHFPHLFSSCVCREP